MPKKIVCSLSTDSINNAIKELTQYRKDFLNKEKQLVEGLARIGVQEASVRFTTAMYDGVNDVTVSLEKTAEGYAIVASGQAVAFI